MKKIMKRFAGATMALLLAVAVLAVALPASASAAGAGKLTVTSTSAEFAGKNVSIWKMFDMTTTGTSYGYAVNPAWKKFFVDKNTEFGLGLGVSPTDEEVTQAAYGYISKLGADNEQKVTEFAKVARKWAVDSKLEADCTVAATTSKTYTAEFTVLDLGYYVVSPAGGSTSVDRMTDAMLVPVKDASATIALKSVYPTVDKTVAGGDHANGEIGSKLTFTLKAAVPDVSEYAKYQFAFKDVLSKGLTFGEFVSVKIGNQDVSTTDYKAEAGQPTPEGKTTLSIKFGTETGAIRDAKALFTGKAGQEIVVTYTAFINADAVVGQAVPNEAKVEYSNDPSKDTVGTSNPDVTHQYDFGFKLKKTDGTDPLAGAIFELRHEATGAAIELVQVREGVYRLAMAGDGNKVTSVTTGATGIIEFHGLAAGDYYLVETKAPEGFNKLAKPVKITITDTTVDGTKPSWTVKVNDAVDAIAGAAGQLPEVVVKNNKGALLPETGGIGTVLFTLGGATLIGYGVYRKRSAKATA